MRTAHLRCLWVRGLICICNCYVFVCVCVCVFVFSLLMCVGIYWSEIETETSRALLSHPTFILYPFPTPCSSSLLPVLSRFANIAQPQATPVITTIPAPTTHTQTTIPHHGTTSTNHMYGKQGLRAECCSSKGCLVISVIGVFFFAVKLTRVIWVIWFVLFELEVFELRVFRIIFVISILRCIRVI